MPTYIHKLKDWPNFQWDEATVIELLLKVRLQQGMLIGRMSQLGFQSKNEAVLQSLTEEVVKSSAIEGENLDRLQVRSSLAKKLGIDAGGVKKIDRNVEGVVEMMLDATRNYSSMLTSARLFDWHSALFPTARSGMHKINVGKWRDDKDGPMQVVSGPAGKTKVHFEAPDASLLNAEMKSFLKWFNEGQKIDLILKAAIAHLWFVTIHPFDDGNGRIARAITDMTLAHSEESSERFYSMSSQISLDRDEYYKILESTQKGKLDVTAWIEWFLNCLLRAFEGADELLNGVMQKKSFWAEHDENALNARQKKVLNRLLDGFEGKLTSSKWAAIAKCSQDTASRDIADLIKRKILTPNEGGGRSTSYSLKPTNKPHP